MKANFALSLSFEGIRLLHRAAGGWRLVGEISLEEPNLASSLAALRKTALGLEPGGLRTKLIIPNEQIKYLTIDAPEDDYKDRLKRAKQALDGATPYRVTQLAYDVSADGAHTHIAAVARETLAEAEQFATEHRFVPISCVATPEDASGFLGEPFFGPTDQSKAMLQNGEVVEPDQVAVVVLRDISEPVGPVVQVADTAMAVSGMNPMLANETSVSDTIISPDALAPEKPRPESEASNAFSSARSKLPNIPKAPPLEPASSDAETGTASQAPVIGFASRRKATFGSDKEAKATQEQSLSASEKALEDEVRRTSVSAPSILDFEDLVPEDKTPEPAKIAPLEDTAPQVPQYAAAQKTTPHRQATSVGSSTGQMPSLLQKNIKRLSATRPEAREIAAARLKSQIEERERLTVFGERQSAGAMSAEDRARPRFYGLILTAMLLLFLAGIAVWYPGFRGGDSIGWLSATGGTETEDAIPDLAEPAQQRLETAEPLPVTPPVQEPKPSDVEVAALDLDGLPAPTVALPQPEPTTTPQTFDADAAEEHYAVTGIWTIPPTNPDVPGLLSLDSLYLTSIDRTGLDFDAVALTQPTADDIDAPIASPANPPPLGTQYELDERGFVKATPEGAITPEGVLVYAGRPPVVPTRFPTRQTQPAVTADDTDRAILAVFRPRLRPLDLQEKNERSNLGGLSRAELADVRPKARPASLQAPSVVAAEDVDNAVLASLRPAARPSDFDAIVKKAKRAPASKPAEPVQTATVAPRTVSPRIPSSASVAKQATVENAINLRKINLMGVYGTPSNRRALVRMSNGRYKKVKVGDRIDGGRVSAIGESELRYQKGSRNVVLKMPKT